MPQSVYTNTSSQNKGVEMGTLRAMELANCEYVPNINHQLSIHLSSNHYPPAPQCMVDPCAQAIQACNEGDYERMISLPDLILYKGLNQISAVQLVQDLHLDFWVEQKEI
jgi:hypothetical protein